MKYLAISLLFLIGCNSNPNNIRIGMKVTNGYCIGHVSAVYTHLNETHLNEITILNPICGEVRFNFITVPLDEVQEVK